MFFGLYSDPAIFATGWTGFSGKFHAWVAVTQAPRTKISQQLKGEIELMENSDLPPEFQTHPDKHPIIFMAGREYDVAPTKDKSKESIVATPFEYRTIFQQKADLVKAGSDNREFLGISIFPIQYLEAIAIVPYVKFQNIARLICPLKLFLDSAVATSLGNFAGIPKEFTWDMEMKINSFESKKILGQKIFDLTELSPPLPGDGNWKFYNSMKEIFNSPIVAPYPGGLQYAFINSLWQLPPPRPVPAQCEVGEHLCKVRHGSIGFEATSDDSPYGMFKMINCLWKLGLPQAIPAS